MMFGLQTSFTPDRDLIAGAHARLQRRMEEDLGVPSMQPGGRTVLPAPAFVYGQGGARLTPDQIAQQERIAQAQMRAGSDTTPVSHWTQGASRVAQALVGSLEQGRLNKASRANADESASVASLLAAGSAGMEPGKFEGSLASAALNPYLDPSLRAYAAGERERIIKANAPDYFMSGSDRVRFDPATGKSTVVYDAPEAFQTYAQSMGYQPGTPEYQTAAQDYVLRGNGPTAYRYDSDLENDRQENRVELEGTRQRNRLTLRGTPTYSDMHPRPRATGGGGSGGAPRQPTMAGAMAPILAKVARGEALTPGEQQAWSMYRPPNRGRSGPTVAGALVASGGGAAPATGGPVRIKSKEDYARLPAGTTFIDPNGVRRVKGR